MYYILCKTLINLYKCLESPVVIMFNITWALFDSVNLVYSWEQNDGHHKIKKCSIELHMSVAAAN